MPKFSFAITAPATVTAQVEVEADTIEEAQERALEPSFYLDLRNARFELDEGNAIRGVYLPDEEDYTSDEDAAPGPRM